MRNDTILPTRAQSLARHLHAGQTDKRGRPYVEHLEAVVGILLRRWPDAPEEAVAAAWLHDALEDSDAFDAEVVDANDLEALGYPLKVIDWVLQVTRSPWTSYANYIDIVSCGDPWSIRIKLADLDHNMDPVRAIPGSDLVERRYAPARRVLEEALAQREDGR